MERKDEAQILSELQGVFLDKFVYSFKQGQNTVTGISWAGIKEIAYRIGEIDTNIEKFEETEDAYVFIVRATNKGVGSRLGVSNQSKMQNGRVDQFALQKALSKAQRNAIRGVIPEATIQQYLDTFLKQGKVDSTQPSPRYEPADQPVDDGSGVFDLASLNSFLLNNEIELVYKDKPISEEVDGILRVFSPPGSKMYEKANTLLRELNFEWIKGGYRWERTA